MAGCCVDNVIMLPKSGVPGDPGPFGEPGGIGPTGPQGTNGLDGGQEVYQAEKIIFNSIFVPSEHGGALTSTSNPFTLTLLNPTQLSPSGGPNQTPGGLLNNIFYNVSNGQDSSGPVDFKYQVWWAQSLNSGVFTAPCYDASLIGYVQKVYRDVDNTFKMEVSHFGVYRMIILG